MIYIDLLIYQLKMGICDCNPICASVNRISLSECMLATPA